MKGEGCSNQGRRLLEYELGTPHCLGVVASKLKHFVNSKVVKC